MAVTISAPTPIVPPKDEPKAVPALVRFIAQAYELGEEEVERFELRHFAGSGDATSHVQRWSGQPRRAPREIAGEAHETAKLDAQAMGGVNTYFLLWYRRGEEAPVARTSFRMAGAALDGGPAPTESPTAAGMRLQEMRHHEAMAHSYMMGVGDVFDAQRTLIKAQREEIEALYADRRKTIAAQEAALAERADIVLKTHERSLETLKAKGAEERKELVTKVFVAQAARILPVVVAKLQTAIAPELGPASLGAPDDASAKNAASVASSGSAGAGAGSTEANGAVAVVPARAGSRWSDEEVAAVVDFLTSLDEATFARILTCLNEEQQARLIALAGLLQKGS